LQAKSDFYVLSTSADKKIEKSRFLMSPGHF